MSSDMLRPIDDQNLYMRACVARAIALDWHQRGFSPCVNVGDLMDRCGLLRFQAEAAITAAVGRGWLTWESDTSARLIVRKALR